MINYRSMSMSSDVGVVGMQTSARGFASIHSRRANHVADYISL
jgi:hypothetical protein